MKKIKIFPFLSFALVFVWMTSGSSKNVENLVAKSSIVSKIKYQVNIHLAADMPICNTYWVQITDETGHLVAPAQVFNPNKDQYIFYSDNKERALRERGSRRIAMLIKAPFGGYLDCVNALSALPDMKAGFFFLGETYSFNLFPVWQTQVGEK